MIENKRGMSEILRIILYIVVIFVTIYVLIWLFYDGGFNTLKSKTSKAVTGESFDKNGSNVESYLTTGERECKLQCSWTNGNNNPVYLYEEIDNSTKGRCYCKY
jgi:hypothetical protein